MTQMIRFLPLTRETWSEFLAPGPALAQASPSRPGTEG